MKPLWLVLTVVLTLAGALAVAIITSRARSWPDCASRVVVGKDPRGRPVECVCIEGRLSTVRASSAAVGRRDAPFAFGSMCGGPPPDQEYQRRVRIS